MPHNSSVSQSAHYIFRLDSDLRLTGKLITELINQINCRVTSSMFSRPLLVIRNDINLKKSLTRWSITLFDVNFNKLAVAVLIEYLLVQ